MSGIYTDPFGNIIDIDEVILTGLSDGVLIGHLEQIETATIGSNLTYSYPTLNLNTILTGITSASIASLYSNYIGSGSTNMLDFTALTSIKPIGTINIGTSLSRFNDLHLAGTASATSYNGTLLTGNQPNITSLGNLTALNMAGNITANINNTYNIGTNASRFNNLFTTYAHIGTTVSAMTQPPDLEIVKGGPIALIQNTDSGSTSSASLRIWSSYDGSYLDNPRSIVQFAGKSDVSTTTPDLVWTLGTNPSFKTTDNFAAPMVLGFAGSTWGTSEADVHLSFATNRRLNLFKVPSTTTDDQTQHINLYGPLAAVGVSEGLSLNIMQTGSPFWTHNSAQILNRLNTSSAYQILLGSKTFNSSGAVTNDNSRNLIIADLKLGINMPGEANPTYTIEANANTTNLLRINDASSNQTMELQKFNTTETRLRLSATKASANYVLLDFEPNVPNTPAARIVGYNTSTTSAGAFWFQIQNGSGTLTDCFRMQSGQFYPTVNLTQTLGLSGNIFTSTYSRDLFGSTTTLNLGYNNTPYLNLASNALSPVSTNTLDIGTSSLAIKNVFTRALSSDTTSLNFNTSGSSNLASLTGSTSAPVFNLLTAGSVVSTINVGPNMALTSNMSLSKSSINDTTHLHLQDTPAAALITVGKTTATASELRFNAASLTQSQISFQAAGTTRSFIRNSNSSTALDNSLDISAGGVLRFYSGYGAVLPLATASAMAAMPNEAGMTLFNTTDKKIAVNTGTVWQACMPFPTKYYLLNNTTYTTTTTGENLSAIGAITFTTGSSGDVRFILQGGKAYQTAALGTGYIGLSTTNGAQIWSSWTHQLGEFNSPLSEVINLNLSSVFLLTASTTYTYYLKFGRTAGTFNCFSGGNASQLARMLLTVEIL